jgi:hypothetical protein
VSALLHLLVMGGIASVARVPAPARGPRAVDRPSGVAINEIAPAWGAATGGRAPRTVGATESAEPVPRSRRATKPETARENGRSQVANASGELTNPPDGGAPIGAEGQGVDLSIGALPPSLLRQLAGPARDALSQSRAKRRFSVDELRVETERQEDAIANVEKGRADPILYDYLRGARRRFETDARRLA